MFQTETKRSDTQEVVSRPYIQLPKCAEVEKETGVSLHTSSRPRSPKSGEATQLLLAPCRSLSSPFLHQNAMAGITLCRANIPDGKHYVNPPFGS